MRFPSAFRFIPMCLVVVATGTSSALGMNDWVVRCGKSLRSFVDGAYHDAQVEQLLEDLFRNRVPVNLAGYATATLASPIEDRGGLTPSELAIAYGRYWDAERLLQIPRVRNAPESAALLKKLPRLSEGTVNLDEMRAYRKELFAKLAPVDRSAIPFSMLSKEEAARASEKIDGVLREAAALAKAGKWQEAFAKMSERQTLHDTGFALLMSQPEMPSYQDIETLGWERALFGKCARGSSVATVWPDPTARNSPWPEDMTHVKFRLPMAEKELWKEKVPSAAQQKLRTATVLLLFEELSHAKQLLNVQAGKKEWVSEFLSKKSDQEFQAFAAKVPDKATLRRELALSEIDAYASMHEYFGRENVPDWFLETYEPRKLYVAEPK